jgi:hypothetical protein
MTLRYSSAVSIAADASRVVFCLASIPEMEPTGVFELFLARTVRTSSMEMPCDAAATGSTWTRTANFCAPITRTWATPGSCEICCASVISP